MRRWVALVSAALAFCGGSMASAAPAVLKPDAFQHHVDGFNAMEPEDVVNHIPNSGAWKWMTDNVPLFECPDGDVERVYYFRWWTFRKHIKQTPSGFVMSEFITPVGHEGPHGTISCAVGHHLREGRWIRDPRYLDDYTRYWFRGGEDGGPPNHFHQFSGWVAAAAYDRFLVSGDDKLIIGLFDDFIADYQAWERERQLPTGVFWQFDVRDGMEESISGSRTARNARPTITSYMYGNARAIAVIAERAGRRDVAREYIGKAGKLKSAAQSQLWDDDARFFKVRLEDGRFSDAREAIGFIPWYFALPDDDERFSAAWPQLTDPQGFWLPWGLTTAERRHPTFMARVRGSCEWDGAVWPFATSQTLTALGNLLNDYRSRSNMTNRTYFDALRGYAKSHVKDGKPYIGEYQHPETGAWLKRDNPRSRFYNHSTFADLVINDLVGIRPRADDVVDVNPLVPRQTWDWFCLDGVPYHGHTLTILWDRDGTRYNRGRGLSVLVDGRPIAHGDEIDRLEGRLRPPLQGSTRPQS
jgi:hypothetical protein